MTYRSDDIVTTSDGRKHRVLWPTRDGQRLYVKPAEKHGKAYMIDADAVVHHAPKVRRDAH